MAPGSPTRTAAYALEPDVGDPLLKDATCARNVSSVLPAHTAHEALPRVPSRARPSLVPAAHGGDSVRRRMSTGFHRRSLDAHLHAALRRGDAFLAAAPAADVLALGAQQAPAEVLEEVAIELDYRRRSAPAEGAEAEAESPELFAALDAYLSGDERPPEERFLALRSALNSMPPPSQVLRAAFAAAPTTAPSSDVPPAANEPPACVESAPGVHATASPAPACMTVLDELSDTDEPSACEESVTGVDVTASPVLAYMAALDAAVVSSGTNRAPLSTCALPDDAAASFIERWSAPLVSSIAAAPGAGGPEFTSVAAAKRRDDWLGEGGFREAVKAEIERVTTHFNAVTVVTASEVRAARRKWPAPGKVAIQHIVFPGKVKTNASGDITRRKARWTIADRVADGKVPGTFSANVSASSTRLLSQLLVVLPGAVATTSDVAGAYFNGKPKPPEEDGGRVLFTPIPKGWDEFGYKQHNERGERLFFRVDSNMPGRQEAGAVWEAEYTAKLKEWGFTQSIVDRRVFMQFDDDGLALVVGVFVDDNWILSQSPKLLAQFTERWMSEYDCAPDMAATKTEFCGVGMVRKDEDTVELHVDGTIDLLGESLTPYGYAGSCAEPMHRDGLKHIQAPPSDDNPLQPPELHEAARRIMGRGGWVVTMVRPDAYFAFTALATQLAMNFTKAVWDGVLRWASYLVATKGLRLTYRRQRDGAPWVTFSDSSVLNAGAGQSFGGHCS